MVFNSRSIRKTWPGRSVYPVILKNGNKQILKEFERIESKKGCSEFYVCFETLTLEHSFLTFTWNC